MELLLKKRYNNLEWCISDDTHLVASEPACAAEFKGWSIFVVPHNSRSAEHATQAFWN